MGKIYYRNHETTRACLFFSKMAGVLTVVAEEVGRAVGLVWGGVGVAIRLNNQVMSVILKITTRIVHLLLLLTQKVQ